LLVEDHAGFAEATAVLMRHHGLDVSIATSGGDALKLAEECRPVLVFCDLTLPDMTGLDVVQALRARRGADDCLAVILSAMSANDLRAIEAGQDQRNHVASQAAHEPDSHRSHCQTRGVAAFGGLGVRSPGPLTEPPMCHEQTLFQR
jgi:CheY-like chemotaxis protein